MKTSALRKDSKSLHKQRIAPRAVSPIAITTNPACDIVNDPRQGVLTLKQIFQKEDFRIFQDEMGRFVVDYSTGSEDLQDAEHGEYKEIRQRLILNKYDALLTFIIYVVPKEFHGLLDQTFEHLSCQSARILKAETASQTAEKA